MSQVTGHGCGRPSQWRTQSWKLDFRTAAPCSPAREPARSERWWNAAPPCGSHAWSARATNAPTADELVVLWSEQVGRRATINAVSGSAGCEISEDNEVCESSGQIGTVAATEIKRRNGHRS